MLRFLVPAPPSPSSPAGFDSISALVDAGDAVVETCAAEVLDERLRATPTDDVMVLSGDYVKSLAMPRWLAELPAWCETRLLLPGASDFDAPVLRAWAAAVDAVVVIGTGADWPETVRGVRVADSGAAGAAALRAACAGSALGPVPTVQEVSRCELPTHYGSFEVTVYSVDGRESALAVGMGDVACGEIVPVRVHSECFTGEVLASLKCDCDAQLRSALRTIADRGRGMLVYLRQEGRGIGLGNKIAAYSEQERGADTIEANRRIGFPADLRDFGAAAHILRAHGVQRVELLTNNPSKVRTLRQHGIAVSRVAPTLVEPNPHNMRYLQVKYEALGHVGLQPVVQPGNGDLSPGVDLVVFDLDGVVQFGREVPAAAIELVERVRAAGHCVRFLTNDGCNSRDSRLEQLRRAGLEVSRDEIYTASYLAARFIPAGTPTLALAGEPGRDELAHLPAASDDARVVVVGDWFDHYDRSLLQKAFVAVQRGAELIAMHRKPHWFHRQDQRIDVGFWVAGLEYCTRRPATIVGKPAAFAYETVRADAGFAPHRVVMVSDELDPDLHGARRRGWRTILFGDQPPATGSHAAPTYAELERLLLRGEGCASS
ncbi:MAG: GTP cyclohydrolase II [Planctomycetota bacterium]